MERIPFYDIPNNLDFGKMYKYLDKCADNDTGHYYNIRPLMTYNKPVIFVTGGRSIGKTTSVSEVPVLNELLYGRGFYFVKQFPEEVAATCEGFFDDAVDIINAYTEDLPQVYGVKYNRRYFEIATEKKNDKLVWRRFGEVKVLDEETKLKGIHSGKSNLIIFDEFINDSSNSYIGGSNNMNLEWRRLDRLITSVDREKGMPRRNNTLTICCSNKMTTYCPILVGAGVIPYANNTKGSIINPKYEGWVWEDTDLMDVGNGMSASMSFGAYLMANDTEEYGVMFDNESADDSSFIKKPDAASYIATFRFKGIEYGIYADRENFWYVWKPQKGGRIIALDSINKSESDFQLLQSWREDYTMQRVVEMYKRNRLYFGNAQIKNAIMCYLKFMP